MSILIVMDRSGDTRHEFDPNDPRALASADRQFRELTGKGFRAVALNRNGQPGRLTTVFDPAVDQILFIPQLRGG
jgi:hypothetical protein